MSGDPVREPRAQARSTDSAGAVGGRESARDRDAGRSRGGTRDDPPPGDGLRVLVVEDSRPMAERIAEALVTELPIASLETVDSEPDALAAQGPWDAAIVDLSLREGNGFSVLRALRRRPGRRPCVVVLTEHARSEFRALATTFGAQAFLDKATEFERLVDTLRPLVRAQASRPPRH